MYFVVFVVITLFMIKAKTSFLSDDSLINTQIQANSEFIFFIFLTFFCFFLFCFVLYFWFVFPCLFFKLSFLSLFFICFMPLLCYFRWFFQKFTFRSKWWEVWFPSNFWEFWYLSEDSNSHQIVPSAPVLLAKFTETHDGRRRQLNVQSNTSVTKNVPILLTFR